MADGEPYKVIKVHVPGAQGPGGIAIKPKGAWDALTQYSEQQMVTYQGSTFYTDVPTLGVEPGTPEAPNAPWQLFVAKGNDGNLTPEAQAALEAAQAAQDLAEAASAAAEDAATRAGSLSPIKDTDPFKERPGVGTYLRDKNKKIFGLVDDQGPLFRWFRFGRLSVIADRSDPFGEKLIRSLIGGPSNKILLGADKAGRLDFRVTPKTKARVTAGVRDVPLHYDREPKSARDCSSLYADGQHWISPTKAYRAYAAGPGVTWRADTLPPRLPLDSIAVAPALAFGWVRLAAGYGGYCCRVIRLSDNAVLDVGFVGNVVDLAAIAAFAGSEMVYMDRMYRQDAAGGFVTAAGADKPVVSPFAMMGPAPSLISQNTICTNSHSNPLQSIALPAGLSLDLANHSVVIAGMFSHSARDIPALELTSADGYGLGFGNRDQTGAPGLGVLHGPTGVSNLITCGFMPHLAPMVIGYDSAGGGLSIHASDRKTVAAAALPSHTMNAGQMGNATRFFVKGDNVTVNQGGMMYAAVMMFAQSLTADDSHAVRLATEFIFQMRPQVRGSVIVDGDSIEDGAYDQYFLSIARRLAPLLTQTSNIYLSAISGGTEESETATFSRKVSACFDLKMPYNILITTLGTNDLGATIPEDADETWAAAIVYSNGVAAAGFKDYLVSPIRPRGSFIGNDKETQRQLFNARMAASYRDLGATAFVDVNLITVTQDPTNTTYYQTDETHYQDPQRALEASFCANAINAYAASRYF